MNFSGPGVWPFPGVWPIAGATAPNVKPPANAAPLLRNPLRSDFMRLSFADEPTKKPLPTVESIAHLGPNRTQSGGHRDAIYGDVFRRRVRTAAAAPGTVTKPSRVPTTWRLGSDEPAG